jgi:hypothetical protein
MKGLATVIVLLGLGAAAATAEPAWGTDCLSCHGLWQSNVIQVFGNDSSADPDESATGAPDRGTLKVFRAYRGTLKSLTAEVQSLVPDDAYAVQLKRLRDVPSYYTQPEIAYRWPNGPTTFSYDITVGPDAGLDYYDLVLAVAGKFNDGVSLFYGEEHFYLEVVAAMAGDLNCDQHVDFGDINPFVLRLSNPAQYQAAYPDCPEENADINGDGHVDFGDINPFVMLLMQG